ncbi:MAG: hypothetical protein WCF04_07665 [Candidatus Nanopelagicales bacterium]
MEPDRGRGFTVWILTRRRGMPVGHAIADMADDVAEAIADELDGMAQALSVGDRTRAGPRPRSTPARCCHGSPCPSC